MTKEELKALGLNDDQVNKIVEDYGKNYVSKAQFNQKNEELKTAKEELKKSNGDLETLRKNNKDNEALVKQIDDLKAEAKNRQAEYDSKIKQMQIDAIVDRSLLTAKAKNPKAVKALLDLTKAEVEEDTIKGLDEQLKNCRNQIPIYLKPRILIPISTALSQAKAGIQVIMAAVIPYSRRLMQHWGFKRRI